MRKTYFLHIGVDAEFGYREEEFRGLETEWNKARSVIRKEWRNGI